LPPGVWHWLAYLYIRKIGIVFPKERLKEWLYRLGLRAEGVPSLSFPVKEGIPSYLREHALLQHTTNVGVRLDNCGCGS
jgi:hypothetical protein